MATLYLDYEGGNDASDGTSFANRVKTYDRIQALYAVGDTIRMMAAPAVQSLGTNIAWVDGQPWVTASSAQWAVIDDFESGWTASANVTITTTSSRKTGTLATSFAIGSAFTTGKAAYKTISSTDFSAYQQISLWMKRSTGTTATLSIALCSDTTGDTVVDSMTLPTATTTSGWIAAVVDKAAALGSSIQSIALYVGTDNGAVTVVLDNLIACKAAGGTGEITHRHMIGRPTSLGAGSGGYDCWFAIRGFEGTKIYVDTDFTQDLSVNTPALMRGTTETVAGYTQKLNTAITENASNAGSFLLHGSTLSGGWNRTDMSTQTHYTWIGWSGYTSAKTVLATLFFNNCTMERINYAPGNNLNSCQFVNVAIDHFHCVATSNFALIGDGITATSLAIVAGTGTFNIADSQITKLTSFGSTGLFSGSVIAVGCNLGISRKHYNSSVPLSPLNKLTFPDGVVYDPGIYTLVPKQLLDSVMSSYVVSGSVGKAIYDASVNPSTTAYVY